MIRFKILPKFSALAAAIITLISGLYIKITPILLLKRLCFYTIFFYLLTILIVKYLLNEETKREEAKGRVIDVRIESDEEDTEFEELKLPVITSMDGEINAQIRGREE